MSVCYIARNTKDVTVKVLLNCALFPSRIALRKHVRQKLRWFCKKKHQQTWKRDDLSDTIQNIFKKADTITPLSSYRFSIFLLYPPIDSVSLLNSVFHETTWPKHLAEKSVVQSYNVLFPVFGMRFWIFHFLIWEVSKFDGVRF